ncbi:MAG: VOC family protein [Acidobacteriota bacterium]
MEDSVGVARGRFVWHELMAADIEAAIGFYGALFGWTAYEMEMGEGATYRVLRSGDRDIGGTTPLEQGETGPSRWLMSVTVDDVTATAHEAKAHGGTVIVPPTPIPGVGEFAVIADPQGASVSALRCDPWRPEEVPPGPGRFCWYELLTTNAEAAAHFYGALFGWGHGTFDMGGGMTYHLFKRDGKDVAGAMVMPADAQAAPMWLPYMLAEDVDASAARAVGLGARQCLAPHDIPGVGRFAVLDDPQGATFALFKPLAG